MNTIKRAIIMAAGKGTRLWPLTKTVPKPLVPVNGCPMIETILNALMNQGIHEIYIVVGYLKEQYEYLTTQYPSVQLIDNPYYDTANNISSLYVAKEHLSDVLVLDGDQVINNAAILSPHFSKSGYCAIWSEEETAEWLLTVDEQNIVTSCSRTGGKQGWQLLSVSRWTAKDGERLKRQLEIEFEDKNNRDIYWDDVAMFCYPDDYQLQIYPIERQDMIEIDSLEELVTMDSSYAELLTKGEKC